MESSEGPPPKPEFPKPKKQPESPRKEQELRQNFTPLDVEKTRGLFSIRERLASFMKEPTPKTEVSSPKDLEAVVVLGGGWKKRTNKEISSPLRLSMESRMRATAAGEMVRAGLTDKLIISGGITSTNPYSEAQAMEAYMKRLYPDIADKVKIELEQEAISTKDNGEKVSRLIEEKGLSNVGLLTNESHLKRSRRVLKTYGIKVNQGFLAEDEIKDRSKFHKKFVEGYRKEGRGKGRERFLGITGLIDKKDKTGHFFAKLARPKGPPPKK